MTAALLKSRERRIHKRR